MKLSIDSRMRLSELRRIFRKYYPYLQPQVSLQEVPSPPGKPAAPSPDLPLGQLGGREFAAELDIDRKTTVASLEDNLRQLCGVSIRIFRRGPFYWEDIPHKDTQCLERQNQIGRVVTRGMYDAEILL
ncbi:hypothetical protein [Flaviaesturariibacter terrae]